MKTGKINSNVGHPKALSGSIREFNVTEQLQRILNFRGINEIKHPVHGKLTVPSAVADYLLDHYFEAELIELPIENFGS